METNQSQWQPMRIPNIFRILPDPNITRERITIEMLTDISPSTKKVLDYIFNYKRSHDGASPSIREICEGCNLRSTSNGFYHLNKLQRAGLIEHEANTARNIRVIGEQWSCPQVVNNA